MKGNKLVGFVVLGAFGFVGWKMLSDSDPAKPQAAQPKPLGSAGIANNGATIPGLPEETQKQLSLLIANGTKAQLLSAADFWSQRGFADVGNALRKAAEARV